MKILMYCLLISFIYFFSGCTAQPKPIDVYATESGEPCTYEDPTANGLEKLAGKAVDPLVWGIASLFGVEKECLTWNAWVANRNLANALIGLRNTLIHSNAPSYQNAQAFNTNLNRAAEGCTSDIDCGLGNSCVKAQFSSSGTCMKKANSKGNQSFDLKPAPIGIKVNPDCRFDTQCPFGFKCSDGSCVK